MNNIIKENDSSNILSSFLSVFNNNQAIMLLVDSENNQKVLDANEPALQFYGYTREEILQLNMGSINTTSEEDRQKMMKKAIKLPHSYYQFEHKTSSGLLKTVEVNASPVTYKNKKVMFIIVHDITELIKTELELKKSNEQFELAMAGSNLGLWDWNVPSGNLEVNERWAELLGYNLSEISPVSDAIWRSFCHPEDLTVVNLEFQNYINKKTNISRADFRIRHKDGVWIWIQTQGKVFEWTVDGEPLRVAGTHLDITERKKTELRLHKSEERFRSYFENSTLSLWEQDFSDVITYLEGLITTCNMDIQTLLEDQPDLVKKCVDLVKIIDVNPATLRLYNAHSKEDLLWSLSRILTEESYSPFKEEIINIYNRELIPTRETTNKLFNGRIINILIESAALSDNRYIKTITDITEIKNIEQQLIVSENKFRSYFESSPLSLWEEDYTDIISYIHKLPVSNDIEFKLYLDTHPEVIKNCSKVLKILDINKATLKMYEADSKKILVNNFNKIFTDKSVSMFKKKMVSIYNKNPYFSDETIHKTLKGREINIKLFSVLLSDNRSLITITDMTEQKVIEKQLVESESKFRSYFESSPLALWEEDYSDLKVYLYKLPVSREDELHNYFNLHPKEVLKCLRLVKILNMNQSALDLYEADSKDTMIEKFIDIFTIGSIETFIDELISLYSNDKYYWGIFHDKTLKGNEIVVKFEMTQLLENRYLTTTTDITELKKKETELKDLLAQSKVDSETKEILLREINHRVKNNLSSFIGMLYAEKKQAKSDPVLAQMEHIDSLINRVKGISIAHDMLSRSHWTAISVFKLIEKIIHSLNHLIPTDREIVTKISPSDIFLDADQSHSAAIIINELFLNSIEHAAKSGEVILVEIKIINKKGKILFIYKDNGPGFPDSVLNLDFKKVGMYLIKNIIEQSLRGTMKITNSGGAKIAIEFPGGSKLEEL